ncbi:calmodulin-binding transcription activator 2-like, partial [Sinocyclocheilus grahami]|uniref:calmodulin-binding transcription activator 2-like n=1 Tax=Sinocyclocheilus grahami TaxID=75366 RepID=UPI0007AD46C0
MDSASSPSSPFSAPPPAGSTDSLFLMDCEASSPSLPLHSELADELLSYSENAENEDYLSDEVLQVDMATLAEQIIEATPERIKQEEFNREAESPLRERRDNPAIHDTMPWLATYLDTID